MAKINLSDFCNGGGHCYTGHPVKRHKTTKKKPSLPPCGHEFTIEKVEY